MLPMSDLNTELKKLIAETFECDVSTLTDELGPGEVPGWDSLGHVTLMTRIHEHFGKHVPMEDAIEVESIADIEAILARL
jgi:acyl carrier protein